VIACSALAPVGCTRVAVVAVHIAAWTGPAVPAPGIEHDNRPSALLNLVRRNGVRSRLDPLQVRIIVTSSG
jgi:hypothetical protein